MKSSSPQSLMKKIERGLGTLFPRRGHRPLHPLFTDHWGLRYHDQGSEDQLYETKGKLSLQLLTTILLLAVCLTSCGTPSTNRSLPLIETPHPLPSQLEPDQVESPTIALVMKTLTNPFFVEMEKGARRAESELGVHLIVKTAAQETSIEQQIGIIEDLIETKVKAIVIAPGDSTELIPILKKAQDAGIVIINIDNRLNPKRSAQLGLVNVPFISVDNEQGAYLAAQYISQKIKSPTQAVILEGIRTAQNAADRKQGALRAFKENPNITVVETATANWKIDEAYNVTKALFIAHPKIGAMFCANDMMALGALKYLAETDRTDVWVAGFDALEEAKQAIRTGTLAVSIDQQAAEQGYLGVHYAAKAMVGQQLPRETMVDVVMMNRESLQ